jgi:cysteinyl-tRNA synthetase
MSLDLLGDGFDIHGGAIDLIFPHHENERAQAVATGRRFARHWVHNGFVEVGGEKMSKSLGNFTNLMDLVESSDPRAYRLLVLRAHYRSPIEVNQTATDDASKALASLDAFARRSADWPTAPPDASALDEFRHAMDDDLDTPRAIAQLFTLVRRANQLADGGDAEAAAPLAAAVREICRAVGLELHEGVGDIPDAVAGLARQRDEARAAQDWAAADRLRDEIQAAGFLVEDTPAGTVVRLA